MGPLEGVRVVELAGIGPAPFAGMMLADMGADVVRVERAATTFGGGVHDFLGRGRRSVALDLKNPVGVEAALALVASADALIEGFRPGVMERLGLGPEVCLARNPKLVFGRMTGWGQTGPWAHMAGHDMNYIAINGALHSFARAGEAPVPPVNTVGDFGGGGMLLAFGVLCGVLHARQSGRGQVIDAAMVDGSALLMTMVLSMRAMGLWQDRAGTNLLDGGSPFYEVHETADGRYLSVGALEPKFYAEALRLFELDPATLPHQMDVSRWGELRAAIAGAVRKKTLAEWAEVAAGTDACIAPILGFPEAFEHPHLKARGTYVDGPGGMQPAPAPRFSATPPTLRPPPAAVGEHTEAVFRDWGVSQAEVARFQDAGALKAG
jgi:alpha-methylacyl-CoA racemase